eukprot:TRINITY_DN11709_c1_g1_i2.p2 TRINITY_DN11709_c1_g1~~TRINITY_DN11709_c1_g1_i2.p2  ORF type:complete len:362 (+),score=62.72 TRINITY_DN11709_c1_g1_i2:288-1373(+)
MWKLRALARGPWKGCKEIKLAAESTEVVLGRNKLTGIQDVRCSREQVKLYLKSEASTTSLWCTFLGTTPGEINTIPQERYVDAQLQAGDRLHLLPGRYAFEIIHVKAPTASLDSQSMFVPSSTGKRKSPSASNHDNSPSPQRAKLLSSHSPSPSAEVKLRSQLRIKAHSVALPSGWQCYKDSVLIKTYGDAKASAKVAAFDFDGCLARTDPTSHDVKAWSMRFANVPEVLKTYHEQGYAIVVLTNESLARFKNPDPIRKGINKKCGRLDAFAAKAGVPMQVFCAILKDIYRKPETGVWTLFTSHFNQQLHVDKTCSFFVGDAAGRPGDFSDSDKVFADRISLKFYTETEFFKNASSHPIAC